MPQIPMARPFLKWAGGKYGLLERILGELPAGSRLVEPFVGSGAVFLNAPFRSALLCDVNPDLIGLFQTVRDEGGGFVDYAASFFSAENNESERYYSLRERFNRSNDTRERAALFVYLNRHAYNGLSRYNAGGAFNVPFGKYSKPRFPREEMLAFHRRSRELAAEFRAIDFRSAFAEVRPGDVVYCDPPYVPLSASANFTAYAAGGFGPADQADLARLAGEARRKGVAVVLSNHDVEETRRLYADADIRCFSARRRISCKGGGRGLAPELVAVYS